MHAVRFPVTLNDGAVILSMEVASRDLDKSGYIADVPSVRRVIAEYFESRTRKGMEFTASETVYAAWTAATEYLLDLDHEVSCIEVLYEPVSGTQYRYIPSED